MKGECCCICQLAGLYSELIFLFVLLLLLWCHDDGLDDNLIGLALVVDAVEIEVLDDVVVAEQKAEHGAATVDERPALGLDALLEQNERGQLLAERGRAHAVALGHLRIGVAVELGELEVVQAGVLVGHFGEHLREVDARRRPGREKVDEPRNAIVAFDLGVESAGAKVLHVLRSVVDRLGQEDELEEADEREQERVRGALAPIEYQIGRLGEGAHGADELEPRGRLARLHGYEDEQEHEYLDLAPLEQTTLVDELAHHRRVLEQKVASREQQVGRVVRVEQRLHFLFQLVHLGCSCRVRFRSLIKQ